MSDIIAAPSVRVLAQKQGVDLEVLARTLGRQTLTRRYFANREIRGGSGATVTLGCGSQPIWPGDRRANEPL